MFKILPFLFVGYLLFTPNLEASSPKDLGDEVKGGDQTHFVIKLGSPNKENKEEKGRKTVFLDSKHSGAGLVINAGGGDIDGVCKLLDKLDTTDVVEQTSKQALEAQKLEHERSLSELDKVIESGVADGANLSITHETSFTTTVINLEDLLGDIDSSSEKK